MNQIKAFLPLAVHLALLCLVSLIFSLLCYGFTLPQAPCMIILEVICVILYCMHGWMLGTEKAESATWIDLIVCTGLLLYGFRLWSFLKLAGMLLCFVQRKQAFLKTVA